MYDLGFHVVWRPKYRRLLLAGWATVGAVPAEAVHRYTGTQNYRSWRKERAR
jgi:REP element-mobilizing transposase RayT